MEGSMTPHSLLAELNSPQQMDRLMEERAEFVSMVKMQQLVRVTCLEVMKGPPDQIEAYRREVIELKTLVQGYLSEVRELRAQGGAAAAPSHPPTPDTASLRSSAPSSPGPPPATLEARFEVAPTTGWYEHKPMPPFSVRLTLPSGEPYPTDDEVVLRVSMLNGRGHREESRANGSGELLSGERNAVVRNGVAEWTTLRVCEPSSKHYASFTLCVSAVKLPDGHGLDELRAPPMTVQVGRMWSKRRKAESELGPDDPITQIPGVGARYVSRLQLQGVTTIGQFAAMAATAAGRDTLCKLCKGDNPRNSLNQAKLQAMIDAANKAAGYAAQVASHHDAAAAHAAKRKRADDEASDRARRWAACMPLPASLYTNAHESAAALGAAPPPLIARAPPSGATRCRTARSAVLDGGAHAPRREPGLRRYGRDLRRRADRRAGRVPQPGVAVRVGLEESSSRASAASTSSRWATSSHTSTPARPSTSSNKAAAAAAAGARRADDRCPPPRRRRQAPLRPCSTRSVAAAAAAMARRRRRRRSNRRRRPPRPRSSHRPSPPPSSARGAATAPAARPPPTAPIASCTPAHIAALAGHATVLAGLSTRPRSPRPSTREPSAWAARHRSTSRPPSGRAAARRPRSLLTPARRRRRSWHAAASARPPRGVVGRRRPPAETRARACSRRRRAHQA